MDSLIQILGLTGPARSSEIVKKLEELMHLTSPTARQRITRAKKPVRKFPVPLLPNREAFVYLDQQRKSDDFWLNFLNAMRETGSVYGLAIDGLIARGGVVNQSEFNVISGAPFALKKQISSQRVLDNLIYSRVCDRNDYNNTISIIRPELCICDSNIKMRQMVENIVIDGVREWVRKLGLAGYNTIGIRGEEERTRMIGSFMWDLAGPSYIVPLLGSKGKPGWFVGDVFVGKTLDEWHIRYFIRKVQLLQASQNHSRILPILIADGFTGAALTKGHADGIILGTPESLFGISVAHALEGLLDTLSKAAAVASANPERVADLFEKLSTIEGKAGNLRGILFELVVAHLAKVQGGSIDFSVDARDPNTGKVYDIDVLRIINKGECVAIECKGKGPGAKVGKADVDDWVRRLPMFTRYLRAENRFQDAKISFELWTSGSYTDEALATLQDEKLKRKANPISWKTGDEVFAISRDAKEKRVTDTLREHFLKHPLATLTP